ncbi:uncharacterized protein Dana_GF15871 [Drosophila ananassae]|uniref:Cytochrome b5 heme-binding domain-containing protein n=1 Tax=Drosophila ananassae TaxID=7217 RepID=B3MKD6_DROAN|nr:membrane steroid-binding protein 2 [Drosophila ananassae]EDV32520.2 uncharacterized protein Dana_GF15871 [Drosophila ananassae]
MPDNQVVSAFGLAKLNPNLEAAFKMLSPLLRNPFGQLVISFMLGYFVTTKLSQFVKKFKGNADQAQSAKSENKELDSDDSDGHLPQGKKVLLLNLRQLAEFNGVVDEQPVYTALNGRIYDLSPAREKYGSQGPYSLLAGCNANQVLNIACGSMGVCTDDVVNRWEQSLMAEFNIVGYLIDSEGDDFAENESIANGVGDLETEET